MKRIILASTFLACIFTEGYGDKDWGRLGMTYAARGEFDLAINNQKHWPMFNLKEQLESPEALFVLSLIYSMQNMVDSSVYYAHQALEAGIPLNRFLAGNLSEFEPLHNSAWFRNYLATNPPQELIHGPMLGSVTTTEARIWVRTVNEVPVKVSCGTSSDLAQVTHTARAQTSQQSDYTAVVSLDGLSPNTRYYYSLEVDNKALGEIYSFKTYPPAGSKSTDISIVFGGGAGYNPPKFYGEYNERVWDTILTYQPSALLLLGDNVYIDDPKHTLTQRYCYYRRHCRPEYRRLISATPVAAIWDDHDFGEDNWVGSCEIDKPDWKMPVWRVFKENWNNFYYGGGEEHPGVWFDFSIGDVQVFMLDCRFYKSCKIDGYTTNLGAAQKQWLLDGLRNSTATFKILASPVPWKEGHGGDKWDCCREEREEIFTLIEEEKINGVILLSADRHRHDVMTIERENGYTLWEFESSKLTNRATHSANDGLALVSVRVKGFGKLSFDLSKDDPEVRYQIVSIDNEVSYDMTIPYSEICHEGTTRSIKSDGRVPKVEGTKRKQFFVDLHTNSGTLRRLRYEVPKQKDFSSTTPDITICDAGGKAIAKAGSVDNQGVLQWPARGAIRLPAGVYYLQLRWGSFQDRRRVVLFER